ncbi:CAMK family protein kinase [Tritrichomonas foetus]|uniref:CAMK family protein kinase n=1 Tax=Tritrichomonas foetus TaxID=1144522 RepID=A0A1J4JD49_9EUKA|nr:CAMK family protein kinase [Tritrichomonas foetus]|eukprot:OHS97118.1 CAMK family protein kinase [Tritrichomonas foetus]
MNESHARQILTSHGYEPDEILGQGGYAIIFKVRSQKYNQEFVAKAMFFDDKKGESRRHAFEVEVASLVQLVHPNVIKIYDSFIDDNYYVQILDYCPNGSLADKLRERRRFKAAEIHSYIAPILDALKYVHSNNISHSDIKPSNILLDVYNRPILADFGLAQKISNEKDNLHYKGSKAYMAPEFYNHVKYDPFKADIWSLGVTIFELATGKLPWNPSHLDNMISLIRSGMAQFPGQFDPNINATVRKMLVVNPKIRPTAEECLSLPLFKQFNDNFPHLSHSGSFQGSPELVQSMSFTKSRRIRKIGACKSRGSLSTLSSILSEDTPIKGRRGSIRLISSGIFSSLNLKPVMTFQESNICDEEKNDDTPKDF